MTYEEAAQCTARLISRAAGDRLTRRDLAEHAGVSIMCMRDYLTGRSIPRLDKLGKLLDACGYELTVSMKRKDDDDDDS